MTPRIVIVVCDGLRPDRIDPVRTPAIWRLREEGAWFANSRTVFPSETRVAAASLVTGSSPGEHGIIANDFYDATIFPDRPIATARAADLEELARIRGRLLARMTLAERVAAAGLRYAVVSTASAGTSAILAAGARAAGAFAWSIHPGCRSPGAHEEVARRFGRPPPCAIPRGEAIAHASAIFTDHVLAELEPDLAIFWCGEPDSTYHAKGLSGPEPLAAERCADEAVRRVVEWRAGCGDPDRVQLVVASDHGHVVGGQRVDIRAEMRSAGWRVAEGCPAAGDMLVVPGAASLVYGLREGTRAGHEFISWLSDQPWFGAAFAESTAMGRATIADLGLCHPRRPDLVFTLRHGGTTDGIGGAGCAYDADLAPGAGLHGGLHPSEMANVLLFSGSLFRRDARLSSPAGIVDIAPTIGTLLGLGCAGMSGRVLREALVDGGPPPIPTHDALQPLASLGRASLSRSHAGGRSYIDGLHVA
jgi:hypothetical protein